MDHVNEPLCAKRYLPDLRPPETVGARGDSDAHELFARYCVGCSEELTNVGGGPHVQKNHGKRILEAGAKKRAKRRVARISVWFL